MAGWHHRLNGHEFGQARGVVGGQGSLVCCGPRHCKESDTTEQLTWTEGRSNYFIREKVLNTERN